MINSNVGAHIVHRRIVHIETKKILQLEENFEKSNSLLIEELQQAANEGNLPLKLPSVIPVCRHGDNFRGTHFEMDTEIARKIARDDRNPLAGYVDQEGDIHDHLESEEEWLIFVVDITDII